MALCDDGTPLVPGDTGLFAGAKLVAAQLRQLARKSGTEAAAPELLRRDLRHKDAPGLAAVTRLLGKVLAIPGGNVYLTVREIPVWVVNGE